MLATSRDVDLVHSRNIYQATSQNQTTLSMGKRNVILALHLYFRRAALQNLP